MQVNVIGYGYWGSIVAKKLEQEGHTIKNLVTNKKNINVNCEKVYNRNQINEVDNNLPTFILTGPLYHHKIIPLFNQKVFVEKPFFIRDEIKTYSYQKPYINYIWYGSSKLKKVKQSISKDFSYLDIYLFSANKIDRELNTVEDFFPHMISILKFLGLDVDNSLSIYSLDKLDEYNIQVVLFCNDKKIKLNFGFSDKTYTKFCTDKQIIESYAYDSILCNGILTSFDTDPLSESIERYLKYYETGDCEDTFISNDFHTLVYNLTNELLKLR